jgi:hypothetical protein
MASGGYRPGGGRPKGKKDSKPRGTPNRDYGNPEREKIRKLLSMGITAKAKIYQEFLVKMSKGEPLTMPEKLLFTKLGAELVTESKDEDRADLAERVEPLEFMMSIVNDPKEDKEFRARMAVAAAPFIHPRKGEGAGKKEEKSDRAKAAGSGKFAASAPPKLKVVGK